MQDYLNGNTCTDAISGFLGDGKTAIITHTNMRLVFRLEDRTGNALFAKGFTNGSIIL